MPALRLDRTAELGAKLVEALYAQVRSGLLASLLSATIFLFLFWDIAPRSVLVGWYAIVVIVSILPPAFALFYQRRSKHERRTAFWLYLFLTGNALVGIAWGLAPFVLVPDDNLLHLAFVALWVCALAAGSVAAYATIFTAFLAFTLPAILPLAGHLFLLDTPETTAIAASLLFYLVFLTLTASNARKILTQALEVQFDNIERINDLNNEKQHIDNLNRQLNADIERRQRIELELRMATQQVQELWHLSSVDGLTGIANRRHFDEYLEKEWGRCLRDRTPMSLILCDIDFFKPYNDRYGHQAGDDCLCTVAGLLKIFARRPGDLASRYGGEEFVLVLPRTATRHATRIAEQVRQGIESLRIQHLESQVSNVITASFGVGTVIPRRGLTPKTLIGRVDKALYEAKQAGRNRVVIASALSESSI